MACGNKRIIKRFIATITSIILVANSLLFPVYASVAPDVLGNGSGGGMLRYPDDGNWVLDKDNWRHGRIIYREKPKPESEGNSSGDGDGDGSSSSKKKNGNPKGHATGKYAKSLSDGDYYWYHQTESACDCVYCGTWTQMIWGDGGTFGTDGCAIYSTAMIVSNLLGKEVTPDDWLTYIGCTINSNHTHCDTSTSSCLTGHCLTAYSNIQGYMEKIGLEAVTEDLIDASNDKKKEGVDKTLDMGGMVWYRISGAYGSHYITIRGKNSKGNYLIMDECVDPLKDDGERTWQQILDAMHPGGSGILQGWINPNAGSDEDDGDYDGDTGDVPVAGGKERSIKELRSKYASQIKLLDSVHKSSVSKTANIWPHDGWAAGITTSEDQKLIDNFAKEHFTADMTPGEKACLAWDWIHYNNYYPYGADFNALEGASAVKAVFGLGKGQCLQYNGAMVAVLRYLGFDAHEVHGCRSKTPGTQTGQGHDHYWCEITANGRSYLIDTGNHEDSGDVALFYFMATFDQAYNIDNSNGWYYYMENGNIIKDKNHKHNW